MWPMCRMKVLSMEFSTTLMFYKICHKTVSRTFSVNHNWIVESLWKIVKKESYLISSTQLWLDGLIYKVFFCMNFSIDTDVKLEFGFLSVKTTKFSWAIGLLLIRDCRRLSFTFCVICFENKDSVSHQNDLLCSCWLYHVLAYIKRTVFSLLKKFFFFFNYHVTAYSYFGNLLLLLWWTK